MRFAVTGDAVLRAYAHDDRVFLDRLADAAARRVFELYRQRERFDFGDFHEPNYNARCVRQIGLRRLCIYNRSG